MPVTTEHPFGAFEEIPDNSSPSAEIVNFHAAGNHYQVLIVFLNSSPAGLSTQANIALASSLAFLGRSQGAAHLLAQLADTSLLLLDRKLYLYALYRCLDDNGHRNDALAHEVETGILKHEAIVYVPRLDGVFFAPSRKQSLYEQVLAWEEAGGLVEPTSFAATVKRDTEASRELENLDSNPEKIFEAIEEFGPWLEVLAAVNGLFRRNKLLLSRLVRDSSSKYPGGLGLLELARTASFKAALAVYSFFKGDYIAAFDWTSLYFAAIDDARRCIRPDFVAALNIRDIITMTMLVTNCLERGVVLDLPTMERIFTRLVNPGAELENSELDVWRHRMTGISENPEIDIFPCSLAWVEWQADEAKLLLGPEALYNSLVQPMRRSQYFLCCGHIRRQMALLEATPRSVKMSSGSTIEVCSYSPSNCIQAARMYIIAAASHPPDDPFTYRLYDRVIWSLCLAGGIHARTLWLFLHLRHRAMYAGNFVPAVRRLPESSKYNQSFKSGLKRPPKSAGSLPSSLDTPRSQQKSNEGTSINRPRTAAIHRGFDYEETEASDSSGILYSGAALSDWPNFTNLMEALHHVQMFVESIHEAVEEHPGGFTFDQVEVSFLSALVFEHQGDSEKKLYMAGEFLPKKMKFKHDNGPFISPELKSQIKLLQPAIEEQYTISKDLVEVWAKAYVQGQRTTPNWASEVLFWAGVTQEAL